MNKKDYRKGAAYCALGAGVTVLCCALWAVPTFTTVAILCWGVAGLVLAERS